MRNRYRFLVAFVLLLSANLLPLTAEYLPFCDLHAHMGLAANLSRWSDPAARTQQLFVRNPTPLLNSLLFEYLGALAGRVLPIPVYTNLFLGIFYVAALPLSLLLLLGSYRREPSLSLLIFPWIYVRLVWYGFVDYLAAVPLILISLALLRRLLDATARPGAATAAPTDGAPRRVWRWNLLLMLSATLLVQAHVFGALIFYGLCLIVLILEMPGPRQLARVILALVPGWGCLGAWNVGRQFVSNSSLFVLLRANREPVVLLQRFYEWSGGGIQTRLVGVVFLLMVLGLLATATWGILKRASTDEPWRRRLQPLALLVVTAVMFVVLPYSIRAWWAINVRLIPLIAAFAIVAIPATRRPPPPLLLAPAIAAGFLWSGYLTWDFHRWFNRVETAGFDQALDAVPPGRMLLALWPEIDKESHYQHFPMAYMGALYMARRGGLAFPAFNVPGCFLQPVCMRTLPFYPVWGQAALFTYAQYRWGWDYFLVKHASPGSPDLPSPFRDAPEGAVRLVARHGLWEVYENLPVTQSRPR